MVEHGIDVIDQGVQRNGAENGGYQNRHGNQSEYQGVQKDAQLKIKYLLSTKIYKLGFVFFGTPNQNRENIIPKRDAILAQGT